MADIIHLNGVKIANHHGVLLQNATCRFRIPTLRTYPLLIVRRTHLSLGVSYLGVQMRLHGCITADHVPALLLCPRLNRLLLSATERERETVCYPQQRERERDCLLSTRCWALMYLCTYECCPSVQSFGCLVEAFSESELASGGSIDPSFHQSSRPEGRLILHSIRARVIRSSNVRVIACVDASFEA